MNIFSRWPVLVSVLSLAFVPALAQSKKPTVALVLSGGGARGGAHVGVLQVLEEKGVPVDLVVGVSYGSLVGGLYSLGYSGQDLELLVSRLAWERLLADQPDRRLADYSLKRRQDRGLYTISLDGGVSLPTGFLSAQGVTQLLQRLTEVPSAQAGHDFNRFKIPFRAVATDLLSGDALVFEGGPLSIAMRASMAVPGIFTPVEYQDTLLVDGGIADNLPVSVALDWGADIVLAVDVSSPLRRRKDEFRSMIDVLDQTVGLQMEKKSRISRQRADVVIRPDLEGFSSADFHRSAQMIPKGRQAALAALDQIRKRLHEKGLSLEPGQIRRPLLDSGFDPETFVYQPVPLEVRRVETEGLKTYSQDSVLTRSETAHRLPTPSAARLDKDSAALYGSGLFDSVRYRLQGELSDATAVFAFKESPVNRLALGLRYDKDYRFTGAFEVTRRRAFNTSFDLQANALVGNVRQLEMGLTSGAFSGRRLFVSSEFRFRTFQRRLYQDNRAVADFEDQRLGWGIALNHLLGNWARYRLGYRIERVNVVRGRGPFVQDSSENSAALSADFAWDRMDQADFANRGMKGSIRFDWYDRLLGGDASFLAFGGEFEQRIPLARGSLGLSGLWKVIDGGAPFYELIYAGGRRYFDFTADPFVGLRRDQIVSKQQAILGLDYRHLLCRLEGSSLVKTVWLDLRYNAGFFGEVDSRDLKGPLHGFGFGASADIRFLGPVRVLLGKAEDNDWVSYFSLGYRF